MPDPSQSPDPIRAAAAPDAPPPEPTVPTPTQRDPATEPTTGATTGPTTGHTTRDAPEPASQRRPAGFDDQGRVRRTRSSAAWVGAVLAAVLMVLLLVFIMQNSDPVQFRYFGWEGEMPLAVAVLLAAVVGVLLVAIPGSLRIYQLRRALVANAKRDD